LNCPSVVNDERKVGGRSLHTRGPQTAKLPFNGFMHYRATDSFIFVHCRPTYDKSVYVSK